SKHAAGRVLPMLWLVAAPDPVSAPQNRPCKSGVEAVCSELQDVYGGECAMKNVGVAFLGTLTALLVAARALAHDLWLVPPENLEPKKTAVFRTNSASKVPQRDHAADPAK